MKSRRPGLHRSSSRSRLVNLGSVGLCGSIKDTTNSLRDLLSKLYHGIREFWYGHGVERSIDHASQNERADALEDAGCTDPRILDHCRQPGEHVRGCWVVDLLLGKT